MRNEWMMGNERLLIIDDDLPTREMMRDIAATLGVSARHTSDPATFLKAARKWKPTHIVVDLKMPQMDGMQVMNQLARQKCFRGNHHLEWSMRSYPGCSGPVREPIRAQRRGHLAKAVPSQ
jgi:CheY-like chemotaxis protein